MYKNKIKVKEKDKNRFHHCIARIVRIKDKHKI